MENPEAQKELPKVYVVDDEKSIRRVVVRLLNKFDLPIEVCEFENPAELLEEVRTRGVMPTMVISDYDMPEMKGDELCRHLREMQINGRPPVVIIITGSNLAALRDKFNAAGVTQAYSKPFDISIGKEIAEKIRELLRPGL